jgi:hypothetical protein
VDTDEHRDKPTKAARLASADARHRLEVVLRPLHDPEHRGWHGYEIHMIEAASGKRASLTSSEEDELFLDMAIDPEVPALCARSFAEVVEASKRPRASEGPPDSDRR